MNGKRRNRAISVMVDDDMNYEIVSIIREVSSIRSKPEVIRLMVSYVLSDRESFIDYVVGLMDTVTEERQIEF